VMCSGKFAENREKFDWKPLYLDAQATTPMVSSLCFVNSCLIWKYVSIC